MEILFVLIPMSTLLIALAIGGFLWAVRSGQYDALEDEGRRILDRD